MQQESLGSHRELPAAKINSNCEPRACPPRSGQNKTPQPCLRCLSCLPDTRRAPGGQPALWSGSRLEVLLDVSRDLSGGSSEVDFFLPRFIRLLSLRPAEHFFLTVKMRRKVISLAHSLPTWSHERQKK